MFKNYFKTAWRNVAKNKLHSFINITGLALGMASAILIFLWIQNEVSHDRFFTKIDRIYLMNNRDKKSDGDMAVWNFTPKPLGLAIKKDYPEVEDVARVNISNANFLISNGEKHFTIHGDIVDTNFLKIFNFPLLKGNAGTALNNVNNILITQQLAKKLFGKEDAMGKTVKIDSVNYATVTGILKDLPSNTSFQFEYLLSWSYATKIGMDDNDWGNYTVLTFVLLKQNASVDVFNKKVNTIFTDHSKESTVHAFAQPYKDAWLYSNVENGNYVGGRIEQVRLFSIIAVFILLIACINFINLSTARSEKRAKEVGIRKVVGAKKHSLVTQFISESIMLAFAAGIIAVITVQLMLPAFNKIVGEKLFINYGNPLYWLFTFLFILFTGIIAGVYPAFFLSSFQPIKVLKGTFKQANLLITPRKILVVLQFTFAIALIICTTIVEDQIKYGQNRDAGYSRNNLAFLIMFGDARKNYELIKQDLLISGAATAVTETSAPMTELWANSDGFSWAGSESSDAKTFFNMFSGDNDFSKTMNLQIQNGRNIDVKNYKTDSTGVLLNETAVKIMRLKDPIGTTIMGNGFTLHVVGVVKDFILQSPYEPIAPMFIMGPVFPYYVINFKLNPNKPVASSLEKAEKIFKQYNPQYPFDVRFYDHEYALKFQDEQKEGTLAGLFAGLTIFISCLGLFGLVTYMAEQRTKEIGIRKVLGASVQGIVQMLSKDFMKLVAIAFVIAAPLAWWAMNTWLQDFSYRINIQWWFFVLAGFGALAIALVTISFQAIKAATANPAKSLRTE